MRWQRIVRITVACLLMGALPGFLAVLFGGMSLSNFIEWAIYGSVYAACIAIPSCLLMPRLMASVDDRPLAMRIVVAVGFLVIASIAGCLLANLIFVASGQLSPRYLWPKFWWSIKICLLISLTVGLLFTAFATLQSKLAEAKNALHRQQLAEERERKLAAEARFASLESRVHPHFLFNTLNSISALIRENPAEAERMVERLSALLRYSLDSEIAGLVALRQELNIVAEYLAIEQVRFGTRLRFKIDMSEEAAARPVPALSIQTLVENSVKFAVGASKEGAEILIAASVSQGTLRVEVSDTGPGFDPGTLKPGHGLDLLQRRLESLFGSRAALEFYNSGGRTTVAITLNA